ncbi:hypothetical protein SELR_pSRC300760 (plasmid) [Selenomonas ruminantium subsp. lactilytica TAM6421]|uniref:Uncharacterized protein n=1 Tax=Selenomonas ruminantium subsp. lactilytica (strain NBRC 103574 / TAM6421) TaxID=927704 RepID=I0GWL2_SELRL|nr:hypothetical protein [Selenomonas ruminantium]BAL85149.1 hypothetical protein SELR_pSRC300760 [Selenomonas ruminantium subsp. lactilytica TAM6421]
MEVRKGCFLLAMVFLIISPLEEIYAAMFWTSLMAWFLAFLFEN